ncbi:MAG: hypothetical protein IKF97_05315 [Clostridia bacterium]|nr:hypothetical protein [Clostridia bacterium]
MRDIWDDVVAERKKAINRKKLILAILIGIVLIAIITLIILYFSVKNFREWVDVSILNKEVHQNSATTIELTDEGSKIYAFNSNIGILSKNKFKIYNGNGNADATLDVDITNPLFTSSNRFLAIAEKSGKKIYVIEDKKILWNTEVEGEISQVHINKNGYVALVITNTSYKTVVSVFDNEGNPLFSKYLATSRLADVCISNDNKFLALAEVDTSGSLIQSNIKIVSVADPKNTEEKIFNGEANSLIINIKFQDNNRLVCMYDNSVHVIYGEKDEVLVDNNKQKVSFTSIELNNNVVNVREQSTGVFTADSIINIINTDNGSTKEYVINDVTKEINTYENVIALNLGSEIEFINTDGFLIKRYIAKQEITNTVISNSIAGIVYRDKVEIVNL